jgi:hypothetical protein
MPLYVDPTVLSFNEPKVAEGGIVWHMLEKSGRDKNVQNPVLSLKIIRFLYIDQSQSFPFLAFPIPFIISFFWAWISFGCSVNKSIDQLTPIKYQS